MPCSLRSSSAISRQVLRARRQLRICSRCGPSGVLERDVTKEAFERVIDNQHPITGQRLTPRMNTTRWEMVWKQNEQTKLWEQVEAEVENRRVGLDLTFSMPKSASVYYGLTKDKAVLQAFLDTNAQMVNWMMADLKVRVRVGGADYDRE